jgi:hypothetical protein
MDKPKSLISLHPISQPKWRLTFGADLVRRGAFQLLFVKIDNVTTQMGVIF